MHAFRRLLLVTTGCSVVGALASPVSAVDASPEVADRPLRVIRTTDIRPNFGLATDIPSMGEVRLAVLVDETGQLRDMLLLGSTHRVFTDAAVHGLQEWRYEPAISDGHPVALRTVIRLNFETHGRVVSISGADVLPGLTGYALDGRYESRLVEATELDRPLRALQTRTPGFPRALVGTLPEGTRITVTVDFYIDETGRPRMPVVVNPEHPLLAAAALDAIDHWRFESPLHRGIPVVVRARQDFVFFESSPAPAAEDS